MNVPRLLLGLAVTAIGLYVAWSSSQQPAGKPTQAPMVEQSKENSEQAVQSTKEAEKSAADATGKVRTEISNVTVRGQDGKVIFRGTVDVGPTLQRIERGEKLRFSHDGVVFENREHRLPKQSAGYYREYIHPTPGEDGPGPQRIVLGKEHETYYTSDHYRTFQRLDQP